MTMTSQTKLTRAARTLLHQIGMTLRRSAFDPNEWRVNFVGGQEASAYYTDDLTDAVATGESMARAYSKQTNRRWCLHCGTWAIGTCFESKTESE